MEKHFAITVAVAFAIGLSGCSGGGGSGGDDEEFTETDTEQPTENEDPPPIGSITYDRTTRLHSEKMGELGESIVIGILDSGIDYTTHEFEDTKFLKGFDAVQNDGDRRYDGNAYTDFDGHGTGVASMAVDENLGLPLTQSQSATR